MPSNAKKYARKSRGSSFSRLSPAFYYRRSDSAKERSSEIVANRELHLTHDSRSVSRPPRGPSAHGTPRCGNGVCEISHAFTHAHSLSRSSLNPSPRAHAISGQPVRNRRSLCYRRDRWRNKLKRSSKRRSTKRAVVRCVV